jgi:hypothetical protein
MEHWQMQCCGSPFSVGSRVEWTIATLADRDHLARVLGNDIARTVTHYEEHHGGLPDDAPSTAGVVRAIRAVRCRYERDASEPPDAGYPVKGSATIKQIHSADGWDADEGEAEFVGYLIDLDAG